MNFEVSVIGESLLTIAVAAIVKDNRGVIPTLAPDDNIALEDDGAVDSVGALAEVEFHRIVIARLGTQLAQLQGQIASHGIDVDSKGPGLTHKGCQAQQYRQTAIVIDSFHNRFI